MFPRESRVALNPDRRLPTRSATRPSPWRFWSKTHSLATKERIKSRLIAKLDPDEWDLPPKPKWMRWNTYNRYEAKFDHYEAILDSGCATLAAKLTGLKIF